MGSSICEVLNGLEITGTTETLRISNIQFEGSATASVIAGVGRYFFSRCQFIGSAIQPHTINIGAGSSQYMTFENCEFNQYTTINVSAFFGNVIYWINCNFGSATINLNQSLSTQVIFNNCAGLVSFPTNATLFGICVLTTGESRNTATTTESTVVKVSYLDISTGNTISSVNEMLVTDGANGLRTAPAGGSFSFYNVMYQNAQQIVNTAASSITLFSVSNQANIIPSLNTIIQFIANFLLSANNTVLTFTLYNDDIPPPNDIQTITQTVSGNNHHNMAINFDFVMPAVYTLSFSITVSASSGNVSTDASDFFSIIMNEIKPA